MKFLTLIKKLIDFFSLSQQQDDYDVIHESILKDIVFKGTNLWILMFAIVIASIGLNMNSTAVIIGAMLISPLMGPINGMGYSIATYNFPIFKRSIKNFSFAVIASLVASTAYFSLTPISTAHSELLARTSPTIYDVLIALFGGLAGIVAISSKQKGNVIPGVAIATALMPPLCTAGYGIATRQPNFFLGAIYLFTINTVFIAISSVVVSRLLRFPIRTLVDASQKLKVRTFLWILILIVILPSIYFGYNLVKQEKFNENANKFIANISVTESNYLLKSEVDKSNKKITLVYGGVSMDSLQKEKVKQQALEYQLADAEILIKEGLKFDAALDKKEREISNKELEVQSMRAELNKLKSVINDKDKRFDSIINSKKQGKIILDEVVNLFPQITNCSYAQTFMFSDTTEQAFVEDLVIFTLNEEGLETKDKERINKWLRKRINSNKLKVFYDNSAYEAKHKKRRWRR